MGILLFNDFCNNAIGIYETFLNEVRLRRCELAIKGVNLSVLSTPMFTVDYVSRIVTDNTLSGLEGDATAVAQAIERMQTCLLGRDGQNALHLTFNDRLAQLCAARGIRYFDLVPAMSARDDAGQVIAPPRLARHLQPVSRDHHLLYSIEVLRWHYHAAGAAFGFA